MTPQARIVFEYGGNTTYIVELDPKAEYTVGRDAECAIHVDEKSVSRRHLLVRHDSKGWCLKNISKTNGIVFKSRLVKKLRPQHGDVFQIGRVACTFAEAGRLLEGEAAQKGLKGEPIQDEPAAVPAAPPAELAEGEPKPEAAETPQPIIVCPVCGSKVQIIDFATIEEISCPACAAQLGRLAVRHLEEAGIFDSVMLRTDARAAATMTIGEYRILAELGEGGMGEVFKGADPSTDQPVAVKLLHPRKGQEQTFAKAFENEARALARIHHKNIVKIFRFGMHGDVHYIAMEFVEGTSVKKMIEEHRKLPLEQAKEILRQSLVGLNHIHRAGIVHNDVKPSNILVDKAGNVKLVDFGIVQLGETHAMERRSFAAGTVEYLSPEVIQGSPPSQQSDLYALGVTLYFMLCGKRPFKGESAQETLRMHVEETAPHPAKHRDIPEPVVAILARLLAKDQAQRYGSAIEVLDDLDAMDLGHSLNKKTLSLGRRWK